MELAQKLGVYAVYNRATSPAYAYKGAGLL